MAFSLPPLVQEFLADAPAKHFVDGQFHAGDASQTAPVLNPSDGTPITQVAMGSENEIDAAVRAAQRAQGDWAARTPVERAVLLHRFADLLEKHAEALACLESLDVGKAIAAARGFDIPFGIECLRYYAELVQHTPLDTPLAVKGMEARVHRAPYGVCGFVLPWNFPFDLLMWGIAPALAAGNTVVVKPAEITPLSTLLTAKLAVEAGIPAGVLNVVVGEGAAAGAALVNHPGVRHMAFTGSPQVGRQIAEACGKRLIPCKLELGGKGAAVVFEDVDVEAVAQQLAGAITLNTGQVCCTATRWVIHRDIYGDFVDAVTCALSAVKIGSSLAEETMMGPLVSETQRQRVQGYLEQGIAQGAHEVLGSGAAQVSGDQSGYFVGPSLLTGPVDNVCFREEIFGPVAYLTTFDNDQGALEQVNSLSYGLANSVWTPDLARARSMSDQMVAGNNWINAHNVFAYGLPYGGVNLSGLGGGVNGPGTLLDYLRQTTVARPL